MPPDQGGERQIPVGYPPAEAAIDLAEAEIDLAEAAIDRPWGTGYASAALGAPGPTSPPIEGRS